MKKIDYVKELIQTNSGVLICPLCKGGLGIAASGALACPSGHSFDIASAGYVNLLTKPVRSEYGRDMLEARNRICRAGFFDGLLREIAAMLAEHAEESGTGALTALDAGCGEGSHLARLAGMLGERPALTVTGIGADISKDGVRIAAREYPGFLWLVADLARLPLADGTCDVIFNILSPSNYSEFGRVLKPGGLLLKAAPGPEYLKELREALYDGGRRAYDGGQVSERFRESFRLTREKEVRYEFTAEGETLRPLVSMTPLAWRAPREKIDAVLGKDGMKVTADFHILAGTAGGRWEGR